MNTNTNKSEVAYLLAQIETAHQAACSALTDPAFGVARHDFISARMEQMAAHQEKLSALIGEEASIGMVIDIFEASPEQKRGAS